MITQCSALAAQPEMSEPESKVRNRNESCSTCPCGILWLNRFRRRMDAKMDTKRKVGKATLRRALVSVLVSIFRPDGVDLVDFRDFRDFRRLV